MIAVPGFVALTVTLLIAAAVIAVSHHHKACTVFHASSVTAELVNGKVVQTKPATSHGCVR